MARSDFRYEESEPFARGCRIVALTKAGRQRLSQDYGWRSKYIITGTDVGQQFVAQVESEGYKVRRVETWH